MKYKKLSPILWTENFDEAIEFYTKVLELNLDEKNEDWKWASLSKDEVSIMISAPNQHEKFEKIGFSGSFYFNVENVDEVWDSLKNKAEICYKLETFDWGMKEFAIYDNSGYILQFGQEVAE